MSLYSHSEQTVVSKHYDFLMRSANYIVILFCFDHVTLTVRATKIASVRDTYCYLFGNNLEAVLEAWEENDDFERNFCDTPNKASISLLNYLIWEQKIGPHIWETQTHLASYRLYGTQSKRSINLPNIFKANSFDEFFKNILI